MLLQNMHIHDSIHKSLPMDLIFKQLNSVCSQNFKFFCFLCVGWIT